MGKTLVALLGLPLLALCCRHAPPPPGGQTDVKSAPTKSSTTVLTRDVVKVELLEPPKRTGRKTRYWIWADLTARETLGFRWPWGEKLRWLQQEGFAANEESCRQFTLPKRKKALAMYDVHYFYSLVLIYTAPAKPKTSVKLSTADGTLQAWLLRHEGHDYWEHYLPLDTWMRLLSAPTYNRSQLKKAFALLGKATVCEDKCGLISKVSEIELSSPRPLPGFTEYAVFEMREARERLADHSKNPAYRDPTSTLHWLFETCVYCWQYRAANEPAKIEGCVWAGWTAPPWNIVWP